MYHHAPVPNSMSLPLQLKTSVLQNTYFAATNGVTSLAEVAVGSRPGIAVGGGDGSLTVFLGYGKDFVDYSRRFVDGAVRSLTTGKPYREMCIHVTLV